MDETTLPQRTSRWRLVLLLLLIAACGGGVFWGIATEAGARVLLPWVVDLALGSQRIEIRLGGIQGTIAGGLEIASLTGNLPLARVSFSGSSIGIKVSPSRLLVGRPTLQEIGCRLIRVSGPPPADWIERLPELPALPAFGCFLIPGTKVEIGRIRVDRLEWTPSGHGPMLVLTDLHLDEAIPAVADPSQGKTPAHKPGTPEASLEQPVRCDGLGTWYGREIFKGALIGSCSNQLNQLLLEGTFAGQLLGIPFKNETRARVGREGVKLDGFLEATTVDVASVSRLFEPFWTPHWSLLRATGTASLSGSWLLDPKLGFQGNLRGGVERVGAFLFGLNLTLLELTAEIVIRQDEITVSDRGSHFCGMPATLQGSLSWSPELPPGGNLILEVPDFRPGDLLASFPWLVRQGMGWPDMNGSAAFKLQIVGRPASVLGNLVTDQLLIEKGEMNASFAGRLTFRQDAGKGPEWRSSFRWRCSDGVPGVLQTLAQEPSPWSKPPSPPVSMAVSLVGPSPSSLDLEGSAAWNGRFYPIEGRLVEGRLEYVKTDREGNPADPASLTTHFLAGGVFLSDLVLFSGW